MVKSEIKLEASVEENSLEEFYNAAEIESNEVKIKEWKSRVDVAKQTGSFPAGVSLYVVSKPNHELLQRLSTSRYTAYCEEQNENHWIRLRKNDHAPSLSRARSRSPKRTLPKTEANEDQKEIADEALDSDIPEAKKNPTFSF